MDYCSLMSGSWGNCHFIQADQRAILIDAGQSCKRVLANMALAGCDAAGLAAILVTHAHHDHVAGVSVLARRLGLAVYATEGAWFEMDHLGADIPPGLRRTIGCDESWCLDGFHLEAFPTSHDALESVGYVVRRDDAAVGIATDCGVFTSRMELALRDLPALVLEANHDPDMLRNGRYPHYLKKRIAGVEGHLSNEDAAAALRKTAGPHTRYVMLAHLSQENNTPDKALETVSRLAPEHKAALTVAPRCLPGAWMHI